MTLTIEINQNVLDNLRREAARQNVDPAEYARRLIESHLPSPTEPPKSLGSLFVQWDAEDATNDPTEIVRWEREWEELKANLNASHTSDRKLFP